MYSFIFSIFIFSFLFISHCLVRPKSFLDFDGTKEAGISSSPINYQIKSGYALNCWFRAETFFESPENFNNFKPTLFSFDNPETGDYFKAYFVVDPKNILEASLKVEFLVKGKQSTSVTFKRKFKEKVWYFIGITHSLQFFSLFNFSSKIYLHVNGQLDEECKFHTSTSTYSSFVIGSGAKSNNWNSHFSFYGQISNFFFFNEFINDGEMKKLYNLGSNYFLTESTKNELLGIFTHRVPLLLFSFSPEVMENKRLINSAFRIQEIVENNKQPNDLSGYDAGVLLPGTFLFTGKSYQFCFYLSGGIYLVYPFLTIPFKRLELIEPNENERIFISNYITKIIRVIKTLLEQNQNVKNEIIKTQSFSIIHLLLKKYLPFQISNEFINLLSEILDIISGHKFLLKQFVTDFLFDFTLWSGCKFEDLIKFIQLLRKQIALKPILFKNIIGTRLLLDILVNYFSFPEQKQEYYPLFDQKFKLKQILPKHVDIINNTTFKLEEITIIQSELFEMIRAMTTSTPADIKLFFHYLSKFHEESVQISPFLLNFLRLLLECRSTYNLKEVFNALEQQWDTINILTRYLSSTNEMTRILTLKVIALFLPFKGTPYIISETLTIHDYIFQKFSQWEFNGNVYFSIIECQSNLISDKYNYDIELILKSRNIQSQFTDFDYFPILFGLALKNTHNKEIINIFLKDLHYIFEINSDHIEQFLKLKFFYEFLLITYSKRIEFINKNANDKSEKEMMGFEIGVWSVIFKKIFSNYIHKKEGWITIEKFIPENYQELLKDKYSVDINEDYIYEINYPFFAELILMIKEKVESCADFLFLQNISHLFIKINEFFFLPFDMKENEIFKLKLNRDKVSKKWRDFPISLYVVEFTNTYLSNLTVNTGNNYWNSIISEFTNTSKLTHVPFYFLFLQTFIVTLRESKKYMEDFKQKAKTQVNMRGSSSGFFDDFQEIEYSIYNYSKLEYDRYLIHSLTIYHKFLSIYFKFFRDANSSPIIWSIYYFIEFIKKLIALQFPFSLEFNKLIKEIFTELKFEISSERPIPSIVDLDPGRNDQFYDHFQILFNAYQSSIKFDIDIFENKYRNQLLLFLSSKRKKIEETAASLLHSPLTAPGFSSGSGSQMKFQLKRVYQKATELIHRETDSLLSRKTIDETEKYKITRKNWKKIRKSLVNCKEFFTTEQIQQMGRRINYLKLDKMEDPLRRRWRLRRNYHGTSYREYSLGYKLGDPIQRLPSPAMDLYDSFLPDYLDSFNFSLKSSSRSLQSSPSASPDSFSHHSSDDIDDVQEIIEDQDWVILKNVHNEVILLTTSCDLISPDYKISGKLTLLFIPLPFPSPTPFYSS